MTFYTIEQIKQFHTNAGLHFFSKGAMRFFNSRVLSTVYYGNIFVTSEKFDYNSPRKYTVRRLMESGNIETIGDFQQFDTANAAKKAAKELSRELSLAD